MDLALVPISRSSWSRQSWGWWRYFSPSCLMIWLHGSAFVDLLAFQYLNQCLSRFWCREDVSVIRKWAHGALLLRLRLWLWRRGTGRDRDEGCGTLVVQNMLFQIAFNLLQHLRVGDIAPHARRVPTIHVHALVDLRGEKAVRMPSLHFDEFVRHIFEKYAFPHYQPYEWTLGVQFLLRYTEL